MTTTANEKAHCSTVKYGSTDKIEVDLTLLRSKLGRRAQILTPSDAGYSLYTQVWNFATQATPSAIVLPKHTCDVVATVKFAREHQLAMTVACGKHSTHSFKDGVLALDLSLMSSITVDIHKKIVTVEGGAKLGEVDNECERYSLAVPVGHNPDTGVGGLTLAGGFGYVCRSKGLTIDCLLEVTIVTADGQVLIANKEENSELFWGIRGGGGNFGIVTRFVFKAFELGKDSKILFGDFFYPLTSVKEVFAVLSPFYNDLDNNRGLSLFTVLSFGPDGVPCLVVNYNCYGDPETYRNHPLLLQLKQLNPFMDTSRLGSYFELQRSMEPLQISGYWRETGGFLAKITEEFVDELVEQFNKIPQKSYMIGFLQAGGAVHDVPPGDTAFFARHAVAWLLCLCDFQRPELRGVCIDWMTQFEEFVKKYRIATYAGVISDSDSSSESIYQQNFPRLRQLKETYDPSNFFCFNRNIQVEK